MKTKRTHNKSIIVRLMVIALSLYMVFTLCGLWSQLSKSQAEYEALRNKNAEEQENIDSLKAILEDGSETALIEKAARERLGFEYSDAIVYIDNSGN